MVSKLNVNRQPGEPFGAAMGRIYKEIEVPGLWNGLGVRIIFMGLPTTGGAAPPPKKKLTDRS